MGNLSITKQMPLYHPIEKSIAQIGDSRRSFRESRRRRHCASAAVRREMAGDADIAAAAIDLSGDRIFIGLLLRY